MTLQQSPATPRTEAASSADLHIRTVDSRKEREEFIRIPWPLYREDRFWVPPLLYDRRQLLSSANPFFEHARMKAWIAYRGSRPVGRVSAQIDQLHLDIVDGATGFFGMLEAEDDPEVFDRLLSTAESWLKANGMRQVVGPFNLSINHDCGLLVDGFGSSPYFMMPHNPPYYEARIKERGYRPVKDTLAYLLGIDAEPTAAVKSVVRRNAGTIHVRQADMRRLDRELEILRDIHRDAWADNWNQVPFTAREFTHLGKDLKMLVPPQLVQIAEIDGEPAAMIVAFPNINEAIADLNGRLMPLGWLKLLWRLKVSFTRTARVALMGIRQKYHSSLLGASLALVLIDRAMAAGRKLGIQQIELSWILEDNQGMRDIIEALGATVHKRYRFFAGDL